MSSPENPVVANWFLARTGVPDEVIGDLNEEYRRRQSRLWLWSQSVMVIVFNAFREVKENKPLALQAMFTGIGCTVVLSYLVQYPFSLGERYLVQMGLWDQSWLGFRGVELLILFIYPLSAVFAGWIVARFYSRYEFGIVFAYLLANSLIQLPALIRLIPLSIGIERYRHELLFHGVTLFLSSVGIVIAALLVDRSQAHGPSQGA